MKLLGRDTHSTVNFVVQAVAKAIREVSEPNVNFNLTQPKLLPYNRWFSVLQEVGFDLEIVSYDKWRQELLANATTNILAPVASILSGMDPLVRLS